MRVWLVKVATELTELFANNWNWNCHKSSTAAVSFSIPNANAGRLLSAHNMKRTARKTTTTKGKKPKPTPKLIPDNSPVAPPGAKLATDFYDQECLQLAQALLGKVLVRKLPDGQILRGTIVETEAYPDPGGEFSIRQTPKNEAMFMAPGTAYVYFTMGMYHCFNISCRGDGAAVLLRGLEPKEEYEIMHNLTTRKGKAKSNETDGNGSVNGVVKNVTDYGPSKKKLKPHELGNGPSKLCMAMDIDRHNCNKLDLAASDELWLETNDDTKYYNGDFTIDTAKRIGIDSAPPEIRNKMYRYFISDNLSVSKANISEIKKRLALTTEAEKGQQEQNG